MQTVKMGVQYSLWGGSIFNLGTEKHKQRYLDDVDSFRLPGGFAMTELRHGSNVAALQTEAVLDTATDEWVVTTPDDGAIKWCGLLLRRLLTVAGCCGAVRPLRSARFGRGVSAGALLQPATDQLVAGCCRCSQAGLTRLDSWLKQTQSYAGRVTRLACRWIGNAAEDGQMASVFARLKVPAADGSGAVDDHGVHAFIVPLRDESGKAAPGVEIRDCGYKVPCVAWSCIYTAA